MSGKYGLRRIIQVDTFVPGKSMALCLDKHVIINGTNGAGKSSTMRLLAFFFGSDPSHLDSGAQSRGAFLDFYLPRPTSLLIFEYQRESGLCCAVAYRHPSGSKHVYRFLGAGFEHEYFTTTNDKGQLVFLEGQQLNRHWKALDIPCSRQIEAASHYRAIIQNDKESIRKLGAADIRSLAAQFCLGSARSSMRYIERVCWAISSQVLNMGKLRDILSYILEQRGVSTPPNPINPKDLKVAADVRSLQNFKSKGAFIQQVLRDHRDYQDAGSALKAHAGAVKLLSRQTAADLKRIDEGIGNLEAQGNTQEGNTEKRRGALITTRQDLQESVNSLDRTLETLTNQHSAHLESGMPALSSDKERLPALREFAAHAGDRYKALVAGVAKEEKTRDEQIHRAEKSFSNARDKVRDGIQGVTDKRSEIEKSKREREDTLKTKADRAGASAKEAFEKAIKPLDKSRLELTFATRHQAPTDEERAALEFAKTDLKKADATLNAAQKTATEAGRVRDSASKERDAGLGALEKASAEIKRREKRRDEIHSLLYAADGTLIKALRDHDPSWALRLGKVIDPSLLLRKDLTAEFQPHDSGSLFGWLLNLEAIDAPEHARSEIDLQRALQQAEQAVTDAQSSHAERKAVQEKLQSAVHQAEKRVREAGDRARHAEQSIARCRTAIETIELHHLELIDGRKRDSEAMLQDVLAEIERRNASFATQKKAIDDQLRADLGEIQSQFSGEFQALEDERKQLERHLASLKSDRDQLIQKIKADYQAACSEKGIDHARLIAAEEEMTTANDRVRSITEKSNEIEAYRTWLRRDWSQLEAHQENLSDTQSQLSDVQDQIDELDAQHKRAMDAIMRSIREHKARRSRKLQLEEQLKVFSRKLVAFKDDAAEPDSPTSPEVLVAEIEQGLNRHEELSVKVQSGVQEVNSIIANYGDTQISNAWELARGQLLQTLGCESIHDPKALLNAPQVLEPFWERDIRSIERSLIEQVRAVGKGLSDLHAGLKTLSSQIKSHARKVNEAVSSTLRIDALSNMEFELKPKVDSLEYWGALADFSASWETWQYQSGADLPPDEFLDQMATLTKALGAVAVETNLSNLFDVELRGTENDRPVRIVSDRDLEGASSEGLKYLMLCIVFIALTRMLCPDKDITLHWPVDEIGKLHPINLLRLIDMLQQNGIIMFAGVPVSDHYVLSRFSYRYEMDIRKGLTQPDRGDLTTLHERARLARQATEGVSQ